MSHRHVDPHDPEETYGMPSWPCTRCKHECCVECSAVAPTAEDPKARLCESCQWWLGLDEDERKMALR